MGHTSNLENSKG